MQLINSLEIGYSGYDKSQHTEKLNKIATDIFRLKNNHNIPESHRSIRQDSDADVSDYDYLVAYRVYRDIQLDWLTELAVCISSGRLLNNVTKAIEQDDETLMASLITDTAMYKWNVNLEEIMEFPVTYSVHSDVDDKDEIVFLEDTAKKRFGRMTVIFILPEWTDWDVNYIRYVLKHEINHMYDMLVNGLNQKTMNSDKLSAGMFSFDVRPLTEEYVFDFLIHNSNNENIRNIILNRLSDLQRLLFIACAVKIATDYINSSELRSYQFNFMRDLNELNKNELLRQWTSDEQLDSYLTSVSETFSIYKNIYDAFGFFINTTSDSLKEEFARDVIRRMFSTRTSSGEYPYGRTFDDNLKHTSKSFDMFFEFHRQRISDIFFKNCHIIYYNLLNDIAAYESYKEFSFMSGKQLFESRLRRRKENKQLSEYIFLNRYLL